MRFTALRSRCQLLGSPGGWFLMELPYLYEFFIPSLVNAWNSGIVNSHSEVGL